MKKWLWEVCESGIKTGHKEGFDLAIRLVAERLRREIRLDYPGVDDATLKRLGIPGR